MLPNERATQPAHNAARAGLAALYHVKAWHDSIWIGAKYARAMQWLSTHA